MVQVNNVVISNNALELLIDVQTLVDNHITSVLVWNHDMYKKFDEKIDVSHKLEQINNRESFSLTGEDVHSTNFEGIWFLEIESDEEATEECSTCNQSQLVIVTNFNHIYRCLASEMNKIGTCDGSLFGHNACCNPSEVNKIMTTHLLLEGIKANLAIGEYALAIDLYKKAMKVCKDCQTNNIHIAYPGCLTCN